jgi:hypothetical protein
MLLDIRFSIFTLGIGAGTFIAALYGMNLKNWFEESNIGFWGVSGISAALSVAVLMYGLGRLRKVQRVSMWGECPPSLASKGWSNEKWAIRERKMAEWVRLKEMKEEGSLWGLGKGTAATGLGALGGPAEIRADRLKKAHEARGQWQQHWQQQHAAKRRKGEGKKGDGEGNGFRSTVSGLGAKPGDGTPGSPALE